MLNFLVKKAKKFCVSRDKKSELKRDLKTTDTNADCSQRYVFSHISVKLMPFFKHFFIPPQSSDPKHML